MHARLAAISLAFAFCASCSSVQTDHEPLPKNYVVLGLFRNENSFPVTVTLANEDGGVYSDGPVDAHGIDRCAIRKGTALVATQSGKQLFKSQLVSPVALKNLDAEKHTIYYRITATAIVSVPPQEGRKWDR